MNAINDAVSPEVAAGLKSVAVNPDEEFVGNETVCRRLDVCSNTLTAWRKSGKIPYIKSGGRKLLFHWPTVKATLLRAQNGGNQ